jgi:hypothetical protein
MRISAYHSNVVDVEAPSSDIQGLDLGVSWPYLVRRREGRLLHSRPMRLVKLLPDVAAQKFDKSKRRSFLIAGLEQSEEHDRSAS